MTAYEKLHKHDDGFYFRGSNELGWRFVEGIQPRSDQRDLLNKCDYRAINRAAKRRNIKGISHT